MKNLFKSICAILLFSTVSASAAFTEGKDYIKLETPLNVDKNSLVKVFSYACQYCYKFDKGVTPKVVSALENGVKFIPMHLSTKGELGETASKVFAVLMVKDEANNISLVDDKSAFKRGKMAIYKAYHDKNEQWLGKDGKRDKSAFIKTALDAAGMSEAEFSAALESKAVKDKLALWDLYAYDIAKLRGVPAYVVAGKYLINTGAVGSVSSLNKLIKELLKK